jgi:hypothetical protein
LKPRLKGEMECKLNGALYEAQMEFLPEKRIKINMAT